MKTRKIKELKSVEAHVTTIATKPKTLDEIWGIVDVRYKYKNIEEYTEFVKEMTDTDVCLHCRELNLPFYGDRDLNFDVLTSEFRKYQFSRRIYPAQDLNVK